MLESMFDQKTVTRNENLRHFREGKKKGEEEAKLELASKLLKDNVPDEKILFYTDLSKEKLDQLKNNSEILQQVQAPD